MKVFFDSSVIIAALLSPDGSSAKILGMCEAGLVKGFISNQVKEEIEKVIVRKFPEFMKFFRAILKISKLKIVKNPGMVRIKEARRWIADVNDAPILAAAKMANIDALLTLDIRHFIKDERVMKKSGLSIMTPADFLKGFIKIY